MIQDWIVLAPAGILCLTPIALYLFWLADVNRRDRPMVVSGVWDFVALLAGLSGIIVCVGILLTALSASLPLTSKKGFAHLRDAWESSHIMAAVTPIAYLIVLAGSAYLVGKARKRTLHVYNIDEAAAEKAIVALFEKLNLPAKRNGNLWSDGRGLLETSTFHVFSHLVVKLLPSDLRLSEEMERELRRSLGQQPVGENLGGPWLTTAAVSAFISTISCVILTFVIAWRK